jgi:hypothetical protein
MRSLYDDIFAALQSFEFSIPDVMIREPYDESPKVYPFIVLHEVVNVPQNHSTVSGEDRTILGYQADIYTQTCTDVGGNVLSAYKAGKVLGSEVDEVMGELKITRRSFVLRDVANDVLSHIWRGDCVADSYGYSYRP